MGSHWCFLHYYIPATIEHHSCLSCRFCLRKLFKHFVAVCEEHNTRDVIHAFVTVLLLFLLLLLKLSEYRSLKCNSIRFFVLLAIGFLNTKKFLLFIGVVHNKERWIPQFFVLDLHSATRQWKITKIKGSYPCWYYLFGNKSF